jgi:hypothetical protein
MVEDRMDDGDAPAAARRYLPCVLDSLARLFPSPGLHKGL